MKNGLFAFLFLLLIAPNCLIAGMLTPDGDLATSKELLYPNPAQNQLNLVLAQPGAIKIVNMQSITVWEGSTPSRKATVNIEDFPAGIYLLCTPTQSYIRFIKR